MTTRNAYRQKFSQPTHVFHDGFFSFATAHYGSWAKDARVTFRVRCDTTPEVRATEKEIKHYDFLWPANDDEKSAWLNGHPTFVPHPDDFSFNQLTLDAARGSL